MYFFTLTWIQKLVNKQLPDVSVKVYSTSQIVSIILLLHESNDTIKITEFMVLDNSSEANYTYKRNHYSGR
jgi:hypothetical protein